MQLRVERSTRVRHRVSAAAVLLVAAACGNSDDAATTPTLTTSTPATSSSTTTAPTTTVASTTTASTAPTTTTTAKPPGEPFSSSPAAGAKLAVGGVPHDEVLNIRARPNFDSEVIAELGPLETDIVATGKAWLVDNHIWYGVTVADKTGWASSRYLFHLGATNDTTAAFIARIGRTPGAETMVDLGREIAMAHASADPPSRIVMVVAPAVGDLGEVTYDVIGLGDDSIGGWRLHVFGTPSASGEGFLLKTFEATTLCTRGVTTDGLCI